MSRRFWVDGAGKHRGRLLRCSVPPSVPITQLAAECDEIARVARENASAAEASNPEGIGDGIVSWWFERGSTPRCEIERFAERVLGPDGPLGVHSTEIEGCEWWVQRRSGGSPLPLHVDTDVTKQASGAALSHPAISSVLYLSSSGGPTVVIDTVSQKPSQPPGPPPLNLSNESTRRFTLYQRPCHRTEYANQGLLGRPSLDPEQPSELDLIFPHTGKYVLFQGSLLHGVLPGLDQFSTHQNQRTEEKSPRTTLLLNYWPTRPGDANCVVPSDKLTRSLAACSERLPAAPSKNEGFRAIDDELDVVNVFDGVTPVTMVQAEPDLPLPGARRTQFSMALPDELTGTDTTVEGIDLLVLRETAMDR